MNLNALNILADAISDVGSWHCWYVKEDMVHVQFCDIQLYDEAKPEKEIQLDALVIAMKKQI